MQNVCNDSPSRTLVAPKFDISNMKLLRIPIGISRIRISCMHRLSCHDSKQPRHVFEATIFGLFMSFPGNGHCVLLVTGFH